MLRSQEHEVWLRAVYKSMPRQLEGLDSNRLTLLYFLASERCIRPSDPFLLQTPAPGPSIGRHRDFTLSSLDILGKIDVLDAKRTIDWVYAMQVSPHQSLHFGPIGPDRISTL